jgi:dTDP-4-amino-4,6-dideoxygalactose transaminase
LANILVANGPWLLRYPWIFAEKSQKKVNALGGGGLGAADAGQHRSDRRGQALAEKPPIPFSRGFVSPDARRAVERVFDSGWLTMGPEVSRFEDAFATYVDAPNAVAVSSCTAGIELALRSLDLPPGSRVLTSTFTFCGAVQAIIHAGHIPVLCDVDPIRLMPSAETARDAVRRSGPVDAMVVVHFAGHPAPIAECADAAGISMRAIVEDAAHALGSFENGRHIGGATAATCYSFYATKNLPIGDGGMVTTPDDDIADFLRRARLHGMSRDAWGRYLPGGSWRYDVVAAGLKANMTDVQAAIGLAHLDEFPLWQERRRLIAERYDAGLAGIEGIERPARPAEGGHAWHLYVIRVRPSFGISRDELFAELEAEGIQTSVHFIPVHRLAHFLSPEQYPGAEAAFDQVLSLPIHPWLEDEEVDRIVDLISSCSRAVLGRRP